MKNLIIIASLLLSLPIMAHTKVVKKNAVKANNFGITYSLPNSFPLITIYCFDFKDCLSVPSRDSKDKYNYFFTKNERAFIPISDR